MSHQPRYDPYGAEQQNEYYSHQPDYVQQPEANPYAQQHSGYTGNDVYGERPAYDPDHTPYDRSPYRSSDEKGPGGHELPVASSDGSSDFNDIDPNSGVKRGLKTRHLSKMALAGIIGPGLLIGAGGALAKGGPASLIIGFGVIGMVAFSIMQSLGELTTLYPTGGAFTGLADRFVDKAFGVGGYSTTLPADISSRLELLHHLVLRPSQRV
jgi:amino acid transporter